MEKIKIENLKRGMKIKYTYPQLWGLIGSGLAISEIVEIEKNKGLIYVKTPFGIDWITIQEIKGVAN